MPPDAEFLRRAVALAARGRGRVEPNPCVGCVVVRNDEIIGEGWHEVFGGPHAEPNALADCRRRGHDPRGATAYVTLEPCCHENKKTPPCAPRLIAAGVARVVAGAVDPNPSVGGRGLAMLRAAGVRVDEPPADIAAACRQLVAPFVAGVVHRRPYVTAKWAQSADGMVAGRKGRPIRITGLAADAAVQQLRGRCDALAVGTNTLVNDDPRLTVRGVAPPHRTPLRVLLSNRLDLPIGRQLFQTARTVPTVVYTAAEGGGDDLRRLGVEIVRLPGELTDRGTTRFSFDAVLADLHARGVTHLLVEPGPTLAAALLARRQIDRVWRFASPNPIGDDGLPTPPLPPRLVRTADLSVGGDRLEEFLEPDSPTYAAAEPSADAHMSQDALGGSFVT